MSFGTEQFGRRPSRRVLTSSGTYYVRTDGSDSNNGLANTSGGAFLTLQKAVDVVAALDLSTYDVTINVADGTYTAGATVSGPWVGSGTVTIIGNTSTPANVIVSTTSASCFTVTNAGRLTLRGMELRTTTSGSCLFAQNGGRISVGSNMRLGTCAAYHMFSKNLSTIAISANYEIVGGATVHYQLETGGLITCNGITVTVTGTPAFTAFASAARAAILEAFSSTYSGAATGTRYTAGENSIIFTNGGGASYFPGNVAGSTSTGGQYS